MSFKLISWETAFERLREIVPNVRYCTPGSILNAAEDAKKKVTFVPASVEQIANGMDDAQMLTDLIEKRGLRELILVTDECFPPAGMPIAFEQADVPALAQWHREKYRMLIFSGLDVVIFCTGSKKIIVYHHEGYLGTVE